MPARPTPIERPIMTNQSRAALFQLRLTICQPRRKEAPTPAFFKDSRPGEEGAQQAAGEPSR